MDDIYYLESRINDLERSKYEAETDIRRLEEDNRYLEREINELRSSLHDANDVRDYIESLGITEEDIVNAVRWARSQKE